MGSFILFVIFDLLFRLTSLTDISMKTPTPPQNISIRLKSLLKNNTLLENITRNMFGLLSKEEKLLLVKKNSQIKQKAGNYIITAHKKKRTRDSGKTRKKKVM